MKNYIILISIVAILSIVSQTSIAAEPVVQASFSVNPSISSPGSDGYIQVTLKNSGNAAANNIKVTITSADLGIDLAPHETVSIGGLGASESTSALFKFSVPKTTSPGLYRINFEINYCQDSSCRTINQFAIINVQSQPVLELKSIKPDRLNVGSNTSVIFAIINNGNSEISNVIITWQESNNLILPLGLSNRIVLSSIDANKQIEIPVEVVTSPTITPGVYPISVKMEYFDKTGAKQNSTSVVGLIVGGTAEFAVDMQEFTTNVLTLSIANIGVNPATSVSINLPNQNEFNVLGANSVFLGNLNPGDSTVASFNVIPRESNKTKELHVKISYTDTSGLRQTVEKDVAVSISEIQPNQRSRQDKQGNFLYIIVGIIAIVVVAYFILKRMKKKH